MPAKALSGPAVRAEASPRNKLCARTLWGKPGVSVIGARCSPFPGSPGVASSLRVVTQGSNPCPGDLPRNFHPAAARVPAVLNTPSGAVVATGGNEAFILRSVGAGCGDGPGITCRGLVSEG